MDNFSSAPQKTSRVVWNTSKIVLAIFLLYIVITKTNYEQIIHLKSQISWLGVAILLVIFTVMSFLKAVQYYALIGKSDYWGVLKTVIWQNTISNFIATSAGITSYMAMLKTEQNIKIARSGIAFIITKLGDLFSILAYLVISSVFVWKDIKPLHTLTVTLILSIFFGLTVFLISIFWREGFVFYLERFAIWIRIINVPFFNKTLTTLNNVAKEKKDKVFIMMFKGMWWSFIYMSVSMFFAYTSLQVFQVSVSIWVIIYVSVLMQLFSFIPIQILGGLGVADVTTVYLYQFFGINETKMSTVVLSLRALLYLFTAILFLYIPLDALVQRHSNKYEDREKSST